MDFEQRRVSDADRELIQRLLCERLSLRGICRAVGVGMKWLMDFIVDCYASAPEDLNVQLPDIPENVVVYCLQAEADELQSNVGNKANKQWLWLAIDWRTRQALAFHVGDRSKKSARALWKKLPAVYRQQATFLDRWLCRLSGCHSSPSTSRHHQSFTRYKSYRAPQWYAATASFAIGESHFVVLEKIGAIQYFLCQYNLELAKA